MQIFRSIRNVVATCAALLAIIVPAVKATAQTQATTAVKTVLLIHGAWADGSSWAKIIPLLEAKGLHVVSVQIPLTSFADDVSATQRAIALEDGPVLLVGHSYGGAVITEAGNDPKVAGLVYVSAVAPDNGESAFGLIASVPTPIGSELRPDKNGFLKLLVDHFHPLIQIERLGGVGLVQYNFRPRKWFGLFSVFDGGVVDFDKKLVIGNHPNVGEARLFGDPEQTSGEGWRFPVGIEFDLFHGVGEIELIRVPPVLEDSIAAIDVLGPDHATQPLA